MEQMRRTIAAALAVTALTAGLGLAACGSSQITVKGAEEVCGGDAQGTSPPGYTDVTAGTQVIVTDPAGTVIGTGTLAGGPATTWSTTNAGLTTSSQVYRFTVTVPGGEKRYGISIGNVSRGRIWFSQQEMQAGPGLGLGC
jgi:hypothetical protein